MLNFEDDHQTGEKYFVENTLPKWFKGIESPVFFDVGANEGNYTNLLCHSFPDSRIIACEPHKLTHARLAMSVPANVETLPVAVGSEPADLTLYDYPNSDGSSHASLYSGVISQSNQSEWKVKVEPIDAIAKRHGLKHIDLLKIDTEGNELNVLKGAEQLLAQDAISVVQLEFNQMNIHSRVFFRDIRDVLMGYHIFRFLPKSMIEIPDSTIKSELFAFQNIIAVAPKFAEQRRLKVRARNKVAA